jgi:glycine hydroxymethyltransferase
MQMVAAKAVAFGEALKPEFQGYAAQILKNSKRLADNFMKAGAKLVTNGTDNHLLLVDCMSSWGIPGAEAEKLLDSVHITLNKNMIPDDPRSPMDPSGIRFGTPAITTRGMKEVDMDAISDFMLRAVKAKGDDAALATLRNEVTTFCRKFPVPGIPVSTL